MCTYSGQYVFDLMDTYGGGISVFWVAIFETIVIMYVYGVNNFSEDISFMVNAPIRWYWRVSILIDQCVATRSTSVEGGNDLDHSH